MANEVNDIIGTQEATTDVLEAYQSLGAREDDDSSGNELSLDNLSVDNQTMLDNPLAPLNHSQSSMVK